MKYLIILTFLISGCATQSELLQCYKSKAEILESYLQLATAASQLEQQCQADEPSPKAF